MNTTQVTRVLLLSTILFLGKMVSAQVPTLITSDVTWAGFLNLTSDVTVDTGATLTISPGTSIYFTNISTDLIIKGSIQAVGSPGSPITFYGTGFGGGSVQVLEGFENAEFEYCKFDTLGSSSLSVKDCGLYIEDRGVILNNCSFSDNIYSIIADADAVGDFGDDNIIEDILFLESTLAINSVWPGINDPNFKYLLSSDVIVPAGISLTIASGAKVNSNATGHDIQVFGMLNAVAAPGEQIDFSSTNVFGGGNLILETGSETILNRVNINDWGNSSLSIKDCGIYVEDVNSLSMHQVNINCDLADMRARADALIGIGNNNSIGEINLLDNSIAKSTVLPNANGSSILMVMEGDLIVPAGKTLIIEPGVEIDAPGTARDIIVNGTLNASGLITNPILFSSSNLFGAGSIIFEAGSMATLSYIEMDNWGLSTLSIRDCALYIDDATVSMDNSIITNSVSSIRARIDALNNIGENNSLEKVNLLNDTMILDATLPNIDPTGFYYNMEGDIIVPLSNTLTINPGVEIRSDATGKDIIVDGTLNALGSAANNIVFTSLNSNGGGSIRFNDGATGVFDYVNLDSLNTSTLSIYDAAIDIRDASVNISNTKFQNNLTDIKALPTRVGNIDNTNSLDLVQIYGGDIDEDATWPEIDTIDFVYRTLADITVTSGNTWTLDPGIDIELSSTARDLIILGRIKAEGNVYDTIHIFSNNSSGGGSLVIENAFGQSTLEYVALEKLGNSVLSFYDAGLEIINSNVALFACRISDAIDGLEVKSGTVDVLGCTFKNNTRGIDVEAGALITQLKRNHFSGNSSFAVQNDLSNSPLFACENWWGNSTGPFNAINNPGGLGDNVNDNVAIAPSCNLPFDPNVVCLPPDNQAFLATGPTSLLLAWDPVPGAFGYRVQATKDDTLTGTFLTAINRRAINIGLVPGDTISWLVKAGCVFDTSANSSSSLAWLPLLAKEGNIDIDVRFWPNPATEQINLSLGAIPAKGALIQITDMAGRTVFSKKLLTTTATQYQVVDVSAWQTGIYIISVESDNGSALSKVIIE